MNAKRKKCEDMVYKVFDELDPSGHNTTYYKNLFKGMSDEDFEEFIKKDFPFRFHTRPFEIEPTMDMIEKAAKVIGVPLMETVYLPHIYRNKDGVPVNTKEALVGYVPDKKMKQFITKKNSMSTDISTRDPKSGRLVGFDKNGLTSDREMEALGVMGLNHTMKEMSRHRADSMQAKSNMYSIINAKGQVSLEEVPVDLDDSLSKNLVNTYLLGALINTNILNEDYYLPKTLKSKD